MVTIGIFYTDTRNPGGPQRLGTVMHLQVYRPPVVMIHGLWSDASAFAGMEQELTASQYEAFQLYRLDYRGTNDSSFMVNYARVADGIDAVIQQGADADLAAGKVDLVTHSMGGVLSRLYIQNPGYEHEVHRIVTCNTPHAGSQMANLLLDRSFDPQGLICRLLSQGMSSATVPNRGCYNGAVDDMRVSSFATTNFLNLGTHPTEVGVHAVATVYDPSLLLNVVPAVASGAGTVPFLIAHLARACGLSLFDSIFNSDDSDLIVSATSQAGGLGGSLTSLYSPQWHMEAAANPDVIGRVKELLNEPANSTSFTSSGYSPGQLPYTTPTSVCPVLRRARTLGSTRGITDTGLTITSPVSGTTLASGESFTVEAAGGTDIATIVLVMSQPEGQMLLVEQPGPAASFEVQVPDTAIGQQNLVVAGLDASGSLVAVSDTVTVEVTVPATLDSITVYPPVVYLRPCGAPATLEITGHYDDGVARDLSAQPGLSLTFATGSAAQSGASGVVLSEARDDTLVVTFAGVDSTPVPLRALVSDDDPDTCGGGSTTTTTSSPPATSTTTAGPSSTTTTTSTTTPTTTTTPETSTTTTTAPEASTTTTVDTSTTTTTTLTPSCQTDTDCDDGDACTGDTCTLAGCEHIAPTGLAGAECVLSAALAEPLCPAGTIGPKLEEFATRKLQRALGLIREATVTTKPKRHDRLLDKAAKALGTIMQHKPGPTTDDCLHTLAGLVDDVAEALSPPPADPTHTIGGTVTGLEGTGLVLHEAGNIDITSGNGAFTFPVAVPSGFGYAVTVAVQPTGPAQICTITNGSGTVGDSDVTDVAVHCVTQASGTTLDLGFGDGGEVRTEALTDAEAVILQPDGKIVAAGHGAGNFALARYASDGSLDPTFGTAGTVTTGFGIGGPDEGFDAAIQADGKIVVVGRVYGTASYDFGVARYNTDGSLDAGFGTGGTVTTDFGGGADYAQGVTIQPDGKIVVAGHARLGIDNDFAVARYNTDGSPDTTFGSGGIVTTNIAGVTDLGQAVALQSDGRIVVAGQVDPVGGFYYHFALARYTTNGSLDTTFGNFGTVVGDEGSAYAVAVQPDDQIVVAGDALGTALNYDFALARYDANGGPDSAFGSGGRTTTDFGVGDDFGAGLAVQPDGRIVVVGRSTSTTIYDLAVARYQSDGSLDTSFGSGGTLTTDLNGSGDSGQDVALQPDGKLVIAGYAARGFTTDFALVRIDP